jgi:hypothetical protein
LKRNDNPDNFVGQVAAFETGPATGHAGSGISPKNKTPPKYLTTRSHLMYTSKMQKASAIPRWWDWASIAILFVIIETTASRLVTTNWTEFLFLGQTVAYIGFTTGVILGYARFSARLSRWISFLYMIVFLPLQWTLLIDQTTSLEEQFLSVGGRLYFSYSDFFANRPVEDPIFFITLITLGFWIIGSSAGFQLVRKQNYLAAVIPCHPELRQPADRAYLDHCLLCLSGVAPARTFAPSGE